MRTEIAIISALTLVLSVPLAFGEIVETKGQNYDLVENFFIGEATWTSHPERIMDGGWQNYALSNTGDKVIFNTNAVGSFVFDKNSCSYSIYGNGFDGEQIIPSVSAVATYLNNGQWQNLPINDEACMVEVSEYEDGVFLTSTKVITEDVTEDVFIPYTGTTENFYVNATNANFELIQSSNGTNIGYYNGETRVLESVEVEKFVQELRLDIHDGFKETFKVWHDGDEQLGVSQTVHTGESITIGDQTINIAELNGQSFDRQFIVDNEAEILALTDSINYDFDTGIESLSNINIIFDGDYKVNMDFADGGFIGYLEIDPTFTSSTLTDQGTVWDQGNNNVCDTATGIGYVTNIQPTTYKSSTGADCARGYMEWDISTIPTNAEITDTTIDFTTSSVTGTVGCDWIGMDTQPSVSTDTSNFVSIGSDEVLLDNDSSCVSVGNSQVDLGSLGDSYVSDNLSLGWTAFGVKMDDEVPSSSNYQIVFDSSVTPTLEVVYTVPIAPNTPTNLSTVTGVPVELDWDSPLVITNYKAHTFTSDGTFQITSGSGNVDYLVVAGGGGGGASTSGSTGGGGGGAGGLLQGTVSKSSGSYTVTVGSGGNGGAVGSNGNNGGNSVFDTLTAIGGGGGARGDNAGVAQNGGSGGGSNSYTPSNIGTGTSGQGNDGGQATSATTTGDYTSGGGGGAGSVGYDGTSTAGGAGGDGIESSITGTATFYAGGGGGGVWGYGYDGGAGGSGIGGDGQKENNAGGNAVANTGSGGGGAGVQQGAGQGVSQVGGNGSDGIVIVRYVDDGSITATGGTVTTFSVSNGGDGGSAITGYKVFRTDNEYAFTELPDNSANSAGIDFTGNEFLTHGFETGSVTPTYTADLSTSSWTTAGTGTQVTIDTTNEEIDFSMNTNNGHLTTGYYDLTTVSDTNWIIRSQLDIDTVTQGSAVNDIFFGFGIGSITNNINDSQDFLGLMIRIDDTKTDIFAVETDGSAPNNETTTLFTRQAQAETLYVELKRDSATSFTVNLYSDSGYSTLLESQTITVPSTVSGLQYIKVAGVQGFSDSELIGSVSNIKFYNDMTTTTEDIIPDKSTNNISVNLESLPLHSNLNHYYKFDESSGTITDSCSTINTSCVDQDSTTVTSVSYGVTGVKDSAIDTSSAGSQVLFPSSLISVNDYSTGSVSVNMWVKSTSSNSQSNNQYVFGNGCDTSTNRDLCFYWRASDNNGAFPHMKDSSTTITTSFNADLNDGNWHMMTGVVDHVNKEVRGYHNGVLYDTNSFTSLSFNPTADWTIGNYGNSGTGNDYDGYVDELTIYENYALTSNDIDDLYELGWHTLNNESTTGVIDTGIQNPNLSFTDSNLPDNTDDFSVGSWVKLDMGRDSTFDGTNNGATTGTTGKIGTYAIDLDGVNDYISINPSISSYCDLSDCAFSAWINTDGGSTANGILGSRDSGNEGMIFRLDGTNHLEVLYDETTNQMECHTQNTLNTNTWYHVAISYDYTSGNPSCSMIDMYVNGVAQTITVNKEQITSSQEMTHNGITSIGNNGHTADSWFNGQIDQVLFYDRPLTSTEVSTLYNSGSGTTSVPTNDLVIHYDFEQTGTTLENQIEVPPTNIKLLNLNDVTFNVGTTSASVVELATAPSYSTNFGTSTGWTVTDSEISVDTANNRIYYDGDLDTTDTSAYYDYYTSQGANLQTWTVDIDITKQSNTNNSHRTEFLITDTLGGVGVAQNAIGITTQANNDMDCRYYAGTTSTTDIGTHSAGNGVTKYVRLSYDGTTFTCDLMDSSRTSVSSSHSATISGVDMSNARYIIISDRDNTNSSVNDVVIEFENLAVTPTNTMESSIISATGLTDNTSTPQHYTFTRSNNDWTIYQNGVSEATATDSTSLGAGGTVQISDTNNFSTDNMVDSDSSRIGISNGVFSAQLQRDGSNDASTYTLSNTYGNEFNMKYEFQTNGLNGYPSGTFGLYSEDNTSGSTTTHDSFVGLFLNDLVLVKLYAGDNTAIYGGSPSQGSSWITLTANTNYFVEIVGNGDDTFTLNIRTGSHTGTLLGTQTVTQTGIDNLSYWGAKNSIASGTSGTIATLDNLSITGQGATSYHTVHIDGMIDEYFINSDSLTSTEVEMAYDKGSSPTQIATTGSTTTEYDDSNVTGGNEYYYTVKATNAIGDSDFLTPFVSALAGTPPDVPTSVSSTINSPNTAPLDITVSWSAPTNVGTGTLTGFEIYRDSVLITTTGLVTSYTDTVPSGGGTFEYKLKAVSTHGTSGFSATTSTTTPSVPPAPTNAPALAINNPNPSPLDIEVSWTEPASGGSIIQSYEVFRSATETGTYTSVGTVTDLDFTDTVPSAGTWYYKFTAINLVGSSGLSPSNSITTASVPSSPLNASSVIPSINSAPYDVTVSWDLPTSTGGSALTGYNVYRQTGTGAFSLITTTTALGYVDTVPTALNQDYTYKIHAVNNVGESTAFTTTTITTGDVPDAPVLSFTTGTTALSWTVPNSDASITGYEIFRDGSSLTTVTTTSHSDFTPINFGQSYQYEVQAISSLGNSANSNSIVTTPETEITGMIVQGITGTGAVIDWEEPAYYQGQITSYNVYYSTPATSANPTTSAGTTTNTYSNFAPTLEYDTSYTFGVTINSPLGNSGFSNLVNATTNVDSSIVAYDPNTGGMTWFDIDSVSEQTVNVIEFQRETQNLNINGTFTEVDTLQVGYPSWWDDMTCDVDYKFAQKTEQYVEGTDMTAVVNSADANQQVIGFQFHDIDNEVIEVECAPQQSTQDDGVSAKYIMTQQNLSTGVPNIPLVTQIQAFQTGDYGTDGEFGALDIVGLFVILISMVGFNRLNPIVGVLLSASLVFGLSFFGIISLPTVLVGIVALVIFLAWGITRNR